MIKRSTRLVLGTTLAASLIAGPLAFSPAWAENTTADPLAISTIQGTGAQSPFANASVTTTGVVTAVYATGGLSGYYIQTQGTGGDIDFSTHKASDAIFVYSKDTVDSVKVGQNVKVTGTVKEYNEGINTGSLTELDVKQGGLTILDTAAVAPKAATVAVPTDAAQRESLEGMLLKPTGTYTISNNYDALKYGQFTLTAGTKPLPNANSQAPFGSAENTAIEAANKASEILLDDASSVNFSSKDNKSIPLPWLSQNTPMRVGTQLTFTKDVILDERYGKYELIPTSPLTAANNEEVNPLQPANSRTASPAAVGGNFRIASYNVENFFTDLGNTNSKCVPYTDRAGNPTNVQKGCDQRGAWDQANFQRQLDKILAGIPALNADVVSLEEIENSARFGQDRDTSLKFLVDKLNAAAGSEVWAYAASPSTVPANEDVIRTAFIYKKANVATVGASQILDDAAYTGLARQPLAQWFKRVGDPDSEAILAVVNHFKSKSSTPPNDSSDTDKGQGASNLARVAQAKALTSWVSGLRATAKNDQVVLLGDFNAYSFEDPILEIVKSGYTDLDRQIDNQSYVYQGRSGSLDHMLVSDALNAKLTGATVWNVNSVESLVFNYSRYNGNVTNFYNADAYAASDHDPVVAGFTLGATSSDTTVNLLNINDFHGRIDSNTVKFAGTVEKLRAQNPDSSAFLSAGDNVGASLFASSIAKDQPTIDVLNALDLQASAVGNHEFDKGFADLTNRIIGGKDGNNPAAWTYLGANVVDSNGKHVLPSYKTLVIGGVKIAVVGTVTQETASLVSPSGIKGLQFLDPVKATNDVVNELMSSSDKPDVIVAEIHDGATEGVKEKATLDEEIAAGSSFAHIVKDVDPRVAAIFTGHTHKEYAWDAPVPGQSGKTRPILQTGSYGENVGQIKLTVNNATKQVTSYEARNVPRLSDKNAPANSDSNLAAAYPRVAKVQTIVNAALASAKTEGSKPLGKINADITTAYIDGNRDDRLNASTLGATVADSISWRLNTPLEAGSQVNGGPVDFSVVNPGGLRSDLLYKADPANPGLVTLAQANAVLPFANTITSVTLTGDQIKTMLEQQWQPDGAARPFLALGVSKDLSFTYDPTAAKGSHISSVVIKGKPLDPKQSYRVGMQSFLAAGGDNFTVITQGTDAKDSGLIDSASWYDYIAANNDQGLSPDFAERGVAVSEAPASVQPGQQVTVKLSKLNLTSLGAPASTSVSVRYDPSGVNLGNGFSVPAQAVPTDLGSTAVTNGEATVTFTVPAELNAGRFVITTDAGTVARLPISIPVTSTNGNGSGDGDGNGTGNGNGPSNGNGAGNGPSNGNGAGNGTGTGNGDGSSNGTGNGTGNGNGGANAGSTGSGLPDTGFNWLPLGAGIATLTLGAVVVAYASRRKLER